MRITYIHQHIATMDSFGGVRSLIFSKHLASRGHELTKYFFKLLSRDGISRVGLSVHLDNMDAIKFYKKDGWKIECVTHNSIYFFHDFNPEDSTT